MASEASAAATTTTTTTAIATSGVSSEVYPSTSSTIKKPKAFYGFITSCEETIDVSLVDIASEKLVFNMPFSIKDIKHFIKKIKTSKDEYKAMIIDIFQLSTPNSMQFCKYLREKFTELQIPHYFISPDDVMYSSQLIAANIKIQADETVLTVMSVPEGIKVAELKYSDNGWIVTRREGIECDQTTDVVDIPALREKILDKCNPKKIIGIQAPTGVPIKKLIRSKKLIIFTANIREYRDRFIIENCKWILDKKYNKFYILPTYSRNFYIFGSYSKLDDRQYNAMRIMYGHHYDSLPIEQSTIVPRSILECLVIFFTDTDSHYQFKPELQRGCHRFKIGVTVDKESFETCNIESLMLEDIKNLPSKLDRTLKSKIPVIGFFDNSSVVCVPKMDENGSYEFLDACNGMIGVDNFISFDEKAPKYGEKAMEVLWSKPSYVVFDFLKIMSMEPTKIEVNSTWGFTITNEPENPVLMVFDDHDGNKTAAKPSFLMAKLLKLYLRTIWKETEKRPEEVGLWIFDNQYGEEETKRVKKGLEEACNLLKIKCTFI